MATKPEVLPAGFPALARSPWLAAVLALLVALPVFLPPILPLVDLGGHLGRYAVQLDAGKDARLAQWFTFDWQLIPNLGVDLFVQLLGPLLGLEFTVRLAVFVSVLLQAFGMLSTARLVHGRITPYALFALPLIYAHSFHFGFLNYNLSLGLLWCSVALWLWMGDTQPRRRWIVFAVVATVLWTCHLVGWGLLCIVLGSLELVHNYQREGKAFPTIVACVRSLSCLLVPWAVRLLTFEPQTGSGRSSGFFLFGNKLEKLFHVFRDSSYVFDTVSLELLLCVILWSLISRWTRLDRRFLLAAVITGALVLVVPDQLLGSYYADQRLIAPALAFMLMALRPAPEAPRWIVRGLFLVAVVFLGARLAGTAMSLWTLGKRSAADLEVLAALPRGAQMIDFREMTCPTKVDRWTIDRRTHLGGYAIARLHAFSNDQWEVPGAQLLRIHNPAAGPFQADETQMQYEVPCRGQPDILAAIHKVPAAIPYLWVNWDRRPPELDGWRVVARNGGSVLYRRTDS